MTYLAVVPDQVVGQVTGLLAPVTGLTLRLASGAPAPEDVKAGWTAFVVFLLLVLAVVFLGRSLLKQLRKAQAAQDAGVYDADDRTADEPSPGPDNGEPHRS